MTTNEVDVDGDGSTADVDCDDSRASVNPGASEVCDGLDNNCDGSVDDGAVDAIVVYADVDGDGHGDPAISAAVCSPPDGFVSAGTDCDDAQSASFPGNAEVCDGLDNDCNGEIDDDPDDVSTWYIDSDGDGYGDPDAPLAACEAPAGYVDASGDCDDGHAGIHPEAAEADCADPVDYNCDGSTGFLDADGDGVAACEDCDDTDSTRSPRLLEVCDEADVDEDCDGFADDQDVSTDAAAMITYRRDVDGDGYASSSSLAVTQCDEPASYSALTGDCDDYDATVNPGSVERCDADDVDEDCDGVVDDADTSTDPASYIGYYRDSDGDLFGDASRSAQQCEPPADYVTDDTDCDDTDVDRNPAQSEVCDALDKDEDCNALADDDDAGVLGTSTWYSDADGDGYGDPFSAISSCAQPLSFVISADDCADGDAAVHPGATEVCDAAHTDEDCDGAADDDDADTSAASKFTWYPDNDGDAFGAATGAVLGCSAPSGYLDNGDDCDDDDVNTAPGLASAESATACMTDADGDGYGAAIAGAGVTAGTDCDDTLAGVEPGATESCSTAYDDNCDGSTNEAGASGCSPFYDDGDGDAYGSGPAACLCSASGAYVAIAGDCDDRNPDVNPAESEVCDAADVDEDCDTYVDDGDSSATGQDTFYLDADADGYGLTASSTSACAAPMGYSPTLGDCDDASAAANPGVTEVCRNATDDDCDGSVDEACPSYAYSGTYDAEPGTDADIAWYGEAGADTYGNTIAAGVDLDNDGQGDFVVGAPGHNYSRYDGAAYAYDGMPTRSLVDADSYDTAFIYGPNSSLFFFGERAHGLEDIDADGNDELAVLTSQSAGSWYIYEGENVSGQFSYSSSSFVYDVISAENVTDAGDGGATGGDNAWMYSDYCGTSKGCTYVMWRTTAIGLYDGESNYDYAGKGIAGGAGNDTNGDGLDELFIGAPGNDAGGASAGAAYVVEQVSTSLNLSAAEIKITGGSVGDQFGYGVRAPGDTDGDGRADLLVAAPYDDDADVDAGVIFLFEDVNTDDASSDAAAGDYEAKIVGAAYLDMVGSSEWESGDVNGDGESDLLIGVPDSDYAASGAGLAYLLYGPLTGTVDLSSGFDARFIGNSASDDCGRGAALGDLDGDGSAEILVGCSSGDLSGAYVNYGAIYIFAGG